MVAFSGRSHSAVCRPRTDMNRGAGTERFACIALLAQQGLRATTSGGHYAVEQAVRAQFGDGFRPFGGLRRRRNELEYPHLPSDAATSEEAEQAAGTALRLIVAAGKLLPQLSFFSQDQEL